MPAPEPQSARSDVVDVTGGWDLAALREPLLKFAVMLTRDVPRSEDLVQRTLERAMTVDTSQVTNPTAWLKRVLRNAFIDEQRHRSTQTKYNETQQAAPRREAPSPCLAGDRLDLTAALKQLPNDWAQALLLVVVERRSYAETGELLGIAEGTVKSRVARARRRLAAYLSDAEPKSGTGGRQ